MNIENKLIMKGKKRQKQYVKDKTQQKKKEMCKDG